MPTGDEMAERGTDRYMRAHHGLDIKAEAEIADEVSPPQPSDVITRQELLTFINEQLPEVDDRHAPGLRYMRGALQVFPGVPDAPDELARPNDPIWDFIAPMDIHLDSHVSPVYKEQPLAQDWGRVAKVGEECGEAIDALIALTGQNPRKGICGTREELLNELADVVMTATLAIQHFTKNASVTRHIVEAKSTAIYERMIKWESENLAALSDAQLSQPNDEFQEHLAKYGGATCSPDDTFHCGRHDPCCHCGAKKIIPDAQLSQEGEG
jgi:hypothetical protein